MNLFPTRPLKWRSVWFAIGWLLVAVVVALSLAPRLPRVDVGVEHLDKIGHFTAYFALMCWFGFIYLRNAYVWIAVMLIAMGVLLESAQYLLGHRHFEVADIFANTVGVAAGLLFARTRFGGLLVHFERRLEHTAEP